MSDALMLSVFWALSRSSLSLEEKIAVLERTVAMLRDHVAEVELAELEAWYGKE
jgi:hypothetical protein